MQVFLDVGVPSSVYETMRSEVMKFLEDNPKSYTGKGQVINCSAGDPMKVQLGFFFEYAHCGEVTLTNRPPPSPSPPQPCKGPCSFLIACCMTQLHDSTA